MADDDTTVVELMKTLGESATFAEGLLDLAESLLRSLEEGECPTSTRTWSAGEKG